jgi:hypothetical protein
MQLYYADFMPMQSFSAFSATDRNYRCSKYKNFPKMGKGYEFSGISALTRYIATFPICGKRMSFKDGVTADRKKYSMAWNLRT